MLQDKQQSALNSTLSPVCTGLDRSVADLLYLVLILLTKYVPKTIFLWTNKAYIANLYSPLKR